MTGVKKGVALLESTAVIASSALERLLRRCTIEAYPAPRSNRGCNSAPYWETSYYYYNIKTILPCWKNPERNFVKNLGGISLLAVKF